MEITPIQPNIPQEPKQPWFSKHMILGLVFVFAVAAASVAGIYYWQTVRQIPTSYAPIVHKDPTADWKTYTNDKYGYEFKYPGNLYPETGEYSFTINSSPLDNVYVGGGVGLEGIEGQDWFRGYSIWVSNEDEKDVNLVSKGEYQVTKLNQSNIEAYEISADIPASGPDVFIKNPKLPNSFVRMGYNSGLKNSQEVDKVFNQILSTFKFTDSNPGDQVTGLKGWLQIYVPSDSVSALDGGGFDPNVWYLASQGSDFNLPQKAVNDTKINITAATVCSVPATQDYPARQWKCLDRSKGDKWGYGDRVVINGTKNNGILTVTSMDIRSSLPVEQW